MGFASFVRACLLANLEFYFWTHIMDRSSPDGQPPALIKSQILMAASQLDHSDERYGERTYVNL